MLFYFKRRFCVVYIFLFQNGLSSYAIYLTGEICVGEKWRSFFKFCHISPTKLFSYFFPDKRNLPVNDFPQQKLLKGLRIVSSPHLVFDVLRKMFLMLYSINWLNFIAWSSLLLEILVNMCIAIVWWPSSDIIYFEINLIISIMLFFNMT